MYVISEVLIMEYQDCGLWDVTLPRQMSTNISEKPGASIFRVEKSAQSSEMAVLIYQTIWHHSQKMVIFKILGVTIADKFITKQGALDCLLKVNPRSSAYARLARNCPSIRARTSISLPLNLDS
jgi:hypothetical protein